MASSIILFAHALLYTGLNLPSVVGKKGIEKNNDAYADDVDTWASYMDYGRIESNSLMSRLTTGVQKWSNLQDVAASSTAFHKYTTQLLGYINERSSLVIDYDFEFDMSLLDIKGAKTQIKLISAIDPNFGLGFSLAPDGNQQHECTRRMTKIRHMCKATVSTHLTQHEAFIMLNCRLTP